LAFAGDRGIQPCLVLTKTDLLRRPRTLRAIVRQAGAEAVLAHSVDWRRQRNPQLYTFAVALMPLGERYVADDRTGLLRRLDSIRTALGVVCFPADGVKATAAAAHEALRLLIDRPRELRSTAGFGASSSNGSRSLLAVWPGTPESFGGSITHIAGILQGFRDCGYRIGLLTCFEPPSLLRSIADDVEVIPPLPPGRRINGDIERLSWNQPLRWAGLELARRMRPSFVYQRHSPFLTAGAHIAERTNLPLVLEWNGSEPWIRNNWEAQWRVKRFLDPLLAAMERNIIARTTLVAAVSQEAAEMAFETGASPNRTVVIPNAVDIEQVDLSLNGTAFAPNNSGPLLGWGGSFGPWHGAEVIVSALSRLPSDVRLVMVGDGLGRPSCEELARSLGVSDRIEWTGALPREVALRTLALCDVLVSPHTPLLDQPFFGSPTKLFEYMALGRPIVASRLGQIGEILDDGVTARLVTPGDVDELVQGVLGVLGLPDRGRHLGEAARREAVNNHTWNVRARALLARLEIFSTSCAKTS
jgi:glycosyltransferase involved in cell wall biosynthesis